MSTTRKASGTLVTTLVAVALAAPAAGAMPLHQASEFDAGHASVATAAAAHQDLRSADARDAAINPRAAVGRQSLPLVRTTAAQPIHTISHDDGTPWVTIVLGLAGGLALAGTAVGASRSIRVRRTGAAA